MKTLLAFLIATLAVSSATLQAQATAPAQVTHRPEVALEYTYAHSNAPPADCGCFSINGGSASFAEPLGRGYWALVFDTTVAHGSGISSRNYDLTLSVLTAGFRFRPSPYARWNPFGEVLIGGEHAAGSLVGPATPAAHDGGGVFALNAGGGLDRRINDRWSIRVVEADYLLTTSTNGVNNRQNNIRISTGVVYHFGKH
jgi:outer membrane immunogenic protein